jgi:hypothetical protein
MGTVESKITIAIAGRTAMLRECRAFGDDTHRNSVSERGANQTGETHGRPSASAVAIVMYMFAAAIRRAAEAVSVRLIGGLQFHGSSLVVGDRASREAGSRRGCAGRRDVGPDAAVHRESFDVGSGVGSSALLWEAVLPGGRFQGCRDPA